MRVKELFLYIAVVVVVVCTIIAAVSLVHGLTTSQGSHMLMHELEQWFVAIGYHLILIVLAASGVAYLNSKR